MKLDFKVFRPSGLLCVRSIKGTLPSSSSIFRHVCLITLSLILPSPTTTSPTSTLTKSWRTLNTTRDQNLTNHRQHLCPSLHATVTKRQLCVLFPTHSTHSLRLSLLTSHLTFSLRRGICRTYQTSRRLLNTLQSPSVRRLGMKSHG